MIKILNDFLKDYIEKHYDTWGTKIETDLPPEFIITDHAEGSIMTRLCCRADKMHKVMVKAWQSQDKPDPTWIYNAGKYHEKSIYKLFNGFIFVFRLRYNKTMGFSQKYLITVYKKSGFQYYDNINQNRAKFIGNNPKV